MYIHMDELIRSLAMGLDAVESDFLGSSTNHGARIATLCAAMGKHLDLSDNEQATVACCALLHDNALTEYILSERPGSAQDFNMVMHCELGQRNAAALPFPADMDGIILYHHERADGTGPFGKREGEFPLGAELIAIADMLDSKLHLQHRADSELPRLREVVRERTGTRFTHTAAEAMLAVLDETLLDSLHDDFITLTVADAIPKWKADIRGRDMLNLSAFVRNIIDYKSEYTKHHSTQIANISWHMAQKYGYSAEQSAQIYLAASMHDLGKLYIPTTILEKDGPLTDDEFATIQNHAMWTSALLERISGFEQVCRWASNHHEKLDGSGYPRHLRGEDLDFVSRLLACIDIYQAAGDKRPYHPGRSHEQTMDILYDMAQCGQLDAGIVADLDAEMAPLPMGEVPAPDSSLLH